MTWLLKLYPPRWQRRYGEEFVVLIESQRFSLGTVLDVIGGAIDAWTRPQPHLAPRSAVQSEGDPIMLAKVMRLRSEGHGLKPTTSDNLKGAALIIAGTVLSVLLASWMERRSVAPAYANALMSTGWLFALVLSMPYIALKGWPARSQFIFIGVLLMVLASLVFGAEWLNSR